MYKLVFQNGSFKKKVLKDGTPKPGESCCKLRTAWLTSDPIVKL